MTIKRGLYAAIIALAIVTGTPAAHAATSPPRTVSARQLFEQGNALLARGETGPAILAFERARVLSPSPVIAEELGRARAQAGLEAEPTPSLLGWVPLAWRTAAAAGLLALFWAGLIAWRRARGAGRWLRATTIACGVLALAAATSVGWEVSSLRHAAIVTTATPARVSPFAGAASEGAFRPGDRVRTLGRFGNFVQVSDGKSRRGWVEAACVESIMS
jgi:hypothetical protein